MGIEYELDRIENLDSNLIICMTEDWGLFKVFRNETDYRSLIICRDKKIPDADTTHVRGKDLPPIDFFRNTLLSGSVYVPQTNYKIQSAEFIPDCPKYILKIIVVATSGIGQPADGTIPYLYLLPVLPDSLEYFLMEEVQLADGTVILEDTFLIKEFY